MMKSLLSLNKKMFSILGVDISINMSFLFTAGMVLAISGPLFLLMLMLSILTHEMGHVLSARRYDVECDGVYFHALGGVALLGGGPPLSHKEEAVVSVAGPLVSFATAGLFYAMYVVFPLNILFVGTVVNVVLGVFNLLPIYPMDGGRVLKAGLQHIFGDAKGYLLSLHVAKVVAAGIAACGYLLGSIQLVVLMVAIVVIGEIERRNGPPTE